MVLLAAMLGVVVSRNHPNCFPSLHFILRNSSSSVFTRVSWTKLFSEKAFSSSYLAMIEFNKQWFFFLFFNYKRIIFLLGRICSSITFLCITIFFLEHFSSLSVSVINLLPLRSNSSYLPALQKWIWAFYKYFSLPAGIDILSVGSIGETLLEGRVLLPGTFVLK